MQKGLDYLISKYSAESATLCDDGKAVIARGKKIPLLPFESERRFTELRSLVKTGRLGNMCTYRIGHTARLGTDLYRLLYREAGIIEYTLDSAIKEVFAIAGEGVMNCILETENGCVCTVELGATLTEGEGNVDKHEIITDSGVACDRAVDTQVPQSSIYVMGQNSLTYTDTDAELYGYSEAEINTVRAAFAVARSAEYAEYCKAKHSHLVKVVEAAAESVSSLENLTVPCAEV